MYFISSSSPFSWFVSFIHSLWLFRIFQTQGGYSVLVKKSFYRRLYHLSLPLRFDVLSMRCECLRFKRLVLYHLYCVHPYPSLLTCTCRLWYRSPRLKRTCCRLMSWILGVLSYFYMCGRRLISPIWMRWLCLIIYEMWKRESNCQFVWVFWFI